MGDRRINVSWPGLARPPTTYDAEPSKDVGGRAKPGHDINLNSNALAAILLCVTP
jgi:hypothetical protein